MSEKTSPQDAPVEPTDAAPASTPAAPQPDAPAPQDAVAPASTPQDAAGPKPLLEITDLDVTFRTSTGEIHAVRQADLQVFPGESVAIVGESGSGKSTLAHAIIDLLPGTGKVTGGRIVFDGIDVTAASKKQIVALRGREIGLVPQDPMSNLNPVWRIGFQVKETLKANNVTMSASGRRDDDGSGLLLSAKGKEALVPLMAERQTAAAEAMGAALVVGSTTAAQAVDLLETAGVPDAVVAAHVAMARSDDVIAEKDAEVFVRAVRAQHIRDLFALMAEISSPRTTRRKLVKVLGTYGIDDAEAWCAAVLGADAKGRLAPEDKAAIEEALRLRQAEALSVVTEEMVPGTATRGRCAELMAGRRVPDAQRLADETVDVPDDRAIDATAREALYKLFTDHQATELKRATDRLVVGSSVRAEVAEVLAHYGVADAQALARDHVTGAAITDRVAGLLSEAGLPDAAARARQYPHEFSGGMRQRALIAIGLAARPKLLIADEPTSALDVTVQRQILDHLGELTAELGTAVLFITHDLGLAAERAEHVVVMYRGRVVEAGPSIKLLTDPQHPYTKRLVAAAPSLASRRIQAAKEQGEEAADLIAATGGDGVSDRRKDILVVDHLTKVFHIRGSRPGAGTDFKAVDDVSFRLKRGTTTALVGESGSGKSTVANIVLSLLEPTSGRVIFDGTDMSTLTRAELFAFRRRVQPIFQDPYGSLDPMFSIYRIIEEPLRVHRIGTKKSREAKVRELLDQVALPASTMRRFPNELSGGQRQRVAIARALALEPEVVVCDEAVSALDVLVQAQILDLLARLQSELGLSYLFITHDLAVVRQIADQVCVMEAGRLVEHATTDEVFDNPSKKYTRDLLEAIPGASIQFVPAGPEVVEG